MTDKELDDLFKQSFSEHRMPVPDDMWQRIQPTRKRRVAFWWWTGLGVAALFLLIGTATWLSSVPSGKNEKTAVSSSSSAKKKAATQAQPETNAQRAEQLPGHDHLNETAQSSASPLTKQQGENEDKSRALPGVDKKNSETNTSSSVTLHVANQQHTSGIDKRNREANKSASATLQAANHQHTEVYKSREEKLSELTSRADEKKENRAAITDNSQATTDKAITPSAQNNSLPATANSTKKQDTISQAATPAVAKKTHHAKPAGIELLATGYGDNRTVYDAQKSAARSVVSLGAIDPKEKTLLYSLSLSVRIDKPITKNLSFKTGLQFLQTHQRITYNQELVNQFAVVNSLDVNSDTMRFAQIQSEKPVVKSIFNSISVPLLISYHTNGSNINVGASAGVLLNLVSWYKGKVPDSDYRQTIAAKQVFKRNTGTALYASMQATKKWGNWQLFAEPNIQYSLSSLTKQSASFKQKMTYYGVGVGIRKSIGK